MADVLQQVKDDLAAVSEQMHAAGLLGQGLLQHQRQLEALMDDMGEGAAADREQVAAEMHELQPVSYTHLRAHET